MGHTVLNFDDDSFPVTARKMIAAHSPISFRISGDARKLLEPFIHDGAFRDTAKLGLTPRLRRLLPVLLLAEVEGQPVTVDVQPDTVEVRVGK